MANARVGNVIYIDTTGVVTTEKNLRVAQIIFTTNGANDAVEFRESSSGNTKLVIKGATANHTYPIPFDATPIHFANGIYVQSLSSSAKVMLVLSGAAGSSGGGN